MLNARVVWGALLFLSSVVLYQNCGAPQHSNVTESFSLFSGSCESSLMNAFGATYYSTFKTKCATCHNTGPGIGLFANKNFQTAFNAFNSMGRLRVERNFLNPNHQAGITGPQNQPLVDRSLKTWSLAEDKFKECAKNAGEDMIPGTEALTVHKSNATILQRARSGNPWVRMDWDLENEMALGADRGKYLLNFSIEIRVAMMAGQMRGYEFRNPMVRLKANATVPYRISKVLFSINQSTLYDVTTYSQMSALVLSMNDFNIAPNAGLVLAVRSPVLATDSFAIAFGRIQTDSTVPIGGDPGGGNTTGGPDPVPLPTAVTHTQLMSTDVNLNVFRRACMNCHSGANPPQGLDITNFNLARARAALIVERMNDNNNPMPPSGMLSDRDRELVRIWQTGGANQ